VNVVDQLQRIWQGLIELTSHVVIPDWGSLIGLLPWAVLLFVVGPILSLLVLGWFVYVVRRPRVGTVVLPDETARLAPIGADGLPDFPRGEPICFRDGLIYPPSAHRCDVCGDGLTVYCPKCGVARSADISTCGNCGLVLKIEPRAVALRPAGPPPGGAAAA
jgi:hypothetical protein